MPEEVPEIDHKTLVEQATGGDAVAIDELIERHYQRLTDFLRNRVDRLVLARESLTDLVQSVCREVIEDAQANGFEYRGEGQFVSWLHRIALSKIIDKHRYHKAEKRDARREVAADGPTGATLGDVCATFGSPSEFAIKHEEAGLLAEALNRLEEDYQEVIFLKHVMDWSHEEIAQQMGRTPKATGALLGRAKARLGLTMRSLRQE